MFFSATVWMVLKQSVVALIDRYNTMQKHKYFLSGCTVVGSHGALTFWLSKSWSRWASQHLSRWCAVVWCGGGGTFPFHFIYLQKLHTTSIIPLLTLSSFFLFVKREQTPNTCYLLYKSKHKDDIFKVVCFPRILFTKY